MKLTIPELSLIVLIGPSGCGKSTFARKHFKPTEVLSSDFCRGLVSDDENSQAATGDAFDVLKYVAGKRLARGLLTVIDATNVQPEARKPLVELAREHDVLPVAIVLKMPENVCHERNKGRPDRTFGPHVVRNQLMQLRRGLRGLDREGFRYVYVLHSLDEVEQVAIERQPLWNNRKSDRGPFDIIGDVHGCFDELAALLKQLGYAIETTPADAAQLPEYVVTPPTGRKAIFLGDLVDRGPKVVEVLRLVMSMVERGTALCVPGNHDVKLLRKLRGKNVQITHGLAETLAQLEGQPPEFLEQTARFIDKLVGHYVLDDGRLVVAHAGMKERYIGRASGRVREFALYGETTGETDEFGLPIRYNWAAEYRGFGHVVYGHTPVPDADWLNRTINIDTGCVFGGKLSALRWPEMEIISVPALRTYAESSRPFLPPEQSAVALTAQQQHDDILDLADVTGKRIVTTRLHHSVTVREENAIAALEVMSRFAADPKWLIYLPPTMSPTETSEQPGLLEHPRQAFDYFRGQGVGKVVCQEKHMGSRAVVVVCRDEQTGLRRFGIKNSAGIIYTRTGRRFFEDRAVEGQLLEIVREALGAAGFWEEFASDWFCLDCELMPWSAKAQDLLKNQYAAVGSASRAAVAAAVPVLEQAAARYGAEGTPDLSAALVRQHERLVRVNRYVDAYRQYCWPVRSVSDLKLAPFHLLASEGRVHVDKDHVWHMQTLARLVAAAPDTPLLATANRVVDVTEPADIALGIAWWEQLTSGGGEGMVVKPMEFVVRGKKGLVQPAVKCRGPEYLRIIYGPEYDAPENLERLRRRGLAAKRSLALREFAMGIEALERFVRREPLRRVHECVFGVLALESEPIDPRL
ncbi:MAG TPA: polynucleotide kinase-phosphatase [Tepidisphaeraceae bacterium]|nr:polynucleotide kinase-phosphatase [Tepidisphaeraceae bacterium]